MIAVFFSCETITYISLADRPLAARPLYRSLFARSIARCSPALPLAVRPLYRSLFARSIARCSPALSLAARPLYRSLIARSLLARSTAR